MTNITVLRIFISAAAVALLVVQVAVPNLRLDAIGLGLVALAALPWVSSNHRERKTARRLGSQVPGR
jgi:Flp pilus assembly protein TadB